MPEVEGSSCSCGRDVYPPRRYCPDCQRPMAGARLPGRGVVETWTTIEVTPEGFEPPVHVALIRLAGQAKGKPATRVVARTAQAARSGAQVELRPEGAVLWADVLQGR